MKKFLEPTRWALTVTFSAQCMSVAAADKIVARVVEDPCPAPPSGYRVGVFDDGRVEMNGIAISTASFKRMIEGLKPDTVICWYRDRPESDDPPPNVWPLSRDLLKMHPAPQVQYYWDPAFVHRISID